MGRDMGMEMGTPDFITITHTLKKVQGVFFLTQPKSSPSF